MSPLVCFTPFADISPIYILPARILLNRLNIRQGLASTSTNANAREYILVHSRDTVSALVDSLSAVMLFSLIIIDCTERGMMM